MALLRVGTLATALLAGVLTVACGQDDAPPPPERAQVPPLAITFTPPDLEGDVVLGIFDAANRLVRSMRFEAGSPELKVETNGYLVEWDGRDDHGAACPGGRYSARGYVVGEAVRVEGEAFHGNDWLAEDHIPATGVKLRAWADAPGVELTTVGATVFAKIREDGALATTTEPPAAPPLAHWVILEDQGRKAVVELGPGDTPVRSLSVPPEEPQPVEVIGLAGQEAVLLREQRADGLERVRLLRRSQMSQQANGRVVTDWEVVFERTLQPLANFGVVDGRLVPDATGVRTADALTVPLVANALQPGPASLQLRAARLPSGGSALFSPEGLPLVTVSEQGEWDRFALVGGAHPGEAQLYQGDRLVVEEFSLSGLDKIAAFDAGSFLLATPAQ